MKPILPPNKLSQRVQLPAEFIQSAEADAQRVGLSLPALLGLSARRGWQATIQILGVEPMSAADRATLGLKPAGSLRPNRRKGGAL